MQFTVALLIFTLSYSLSSLTEWILYLDYDVMRYFNLKKKKKVQLGEPAHKGSGLKRAHYPVRLFLIHVICRKCIQGMNT